MFDSYNGSCYHLHLVRMDYDASLEYCLNRGGNLLAIISLEEQETISGYLG